MTAKYSHAELLDFVKKEETPPNWNWTPEEHFYWEIAVAIKSLDDVMKQLAKHPSFEPDLPLFLFAQNYNHQASEKLFLRMKELKEKTDRLEKIGHDFYRLSISALHEIMSLYPSSDKTLEAEEFRKILRLREREEEQAKKAINLSLKNDNSAFLDPHLPLRASTFRYLAERSRKSSLVFRYLTLLYANCGADDLTPSDAVEYYLILKAEVDSRIDASVSMVESTRFTVWQRYSAAFIAELGKRGALDNLTWICRTGNNSRKLVFGSLVPSHFNKEGEARVKELQETDLTKLSQTCNDVTTFACFGIRCKAEIAHIAKGTEMFELWRDSLPDISPIVTVKC